MEKIPTETQIADMDILSAKQLRKKLTKRISAIRVTDTIRIQTIISAEKKTAMELAIDWLHRNKIIPNKTRYGFLKFAVENTIKLVLAQREKEELLEQQQIAQNSQRQPMPGQDEIN